MVKDNPVKNRLKVPGKQKIPFLDEPDLHAGVTRFWLVRHALVAPHARQVMYGSEEVPLCCETLRAQEVIYRALSSHLPRPAYWLTSPLKRAVLTAQTLLKSGKLSVTLKEEPRLAEQSLGAWSGLSYEAFCDRRVQQASDFWALSPEECPPGGESLEDVRERVGAALEFWAQENRGQETVMVTHGGVIRMALAHALGISAGAALHFTVQNLSVTVIEHIADQWRVVSVNTLSHFRERNV